VLFGDANSHERKQRQSALQLSASGRTRHRTEQRATKLERGLTRPGNTASLQALISKTVAFEGAARELSDSMNFEPFDNSTTYTMLTTFRFVNSCLTFPC
jgi:D-serine deaminase-like pyridoxal phosphate-dependent protein